MAFCKNQVRVLASSWALVLFIMVSVTFGQTTCCLSQLADTMISTLKSVGFTNMTAAPGATCTFLSMSGNMNSGTVSIPVTITEQVVGADLITTISMMTVTQKDTTKSWCSAGIRQQLDFRKAMSSFYAYPNPFTSELTLAFYNPKKNAVLQVFDVNGTMVDEIKNIKGSQVIYKPSVAMQRVFLIRLRTQDRVYTARLTHIK